MMLFAVAVLALVMVGALGEVLGEV